MLPGATYTKGFLRAYAEYLGLDGQLFIDEFNSRHHDTRTPQEQPIASQPRSRPHQRRQRRESNLVMIVLAAIVAVSALVLLATTFPNATAPYPNTTTPGGGTSTPTTTSGDNTQTKKKHTLTGAPAPERRPRPLVEHVRAEPRRAVRAAPGRSRRRGPTWGRGSSVDPALTGSSRVLFTARAPIFLRLGNPAAVTLTINGKTVSLPAKVRSNGLIRIMSAGNVKDLNRPAAAILLTGNELLRGVIADQNGAHLAASLERHGFAVRRTLVVGDSLDDIERGPARADRPGGARRLVGRPWADARRPHRRGARARRRRRSGARRGGAGADRSLDRPGRGPLRARAGRLRRREPKAGACARRRGGAGDGGDGAGPHRARRRVGRRRSPGRAVGAPPPVGGRARAIPRWPMCSRALGRGPAGSCARTASASRTSPTSTGRPEAIRRASRRRSARGASRSRSTSGPIPGREQAGEAFAAVMRTELEPHVFATDERPLAEIVLDLLRSQGMDRRDRRVVHGRDGRGRPHRHRRELGRLHRGRCRLLECTEARHALCLRGAPRRARRGERGGCRGDGERGPRPPRGGRRGVHDRDRRARGRQPRRSPSGWCTCTSLARRRGRAPDGHPGVARGGAGTGRDGRPSAHARSSRHTFLTPGPLPSSGGPSTILRRTCVRVNRRRRRRLRQYGQTRPAGRLYGIEE